MMHPFVKRLVHVVLILVPMTVLGAESIVPSPRLPRTMPWDLKKLSNPPAFEWIDLQGPVRALFYESEPYEGKKSFDLVPGVKQIRVTVNMPHGHPPGWAPQEIRLFIDQQLRGGQALPTVSEPRLDGSHIRLDCGGPVKLTQAALHLTKDGGPINKRQWQTLPATIDGNRVTADAPATQATAWFLTVTDERGAIVSSRVTIAQHSQLREENFDREPTSWEGVNHRSQHFPPRPVMQDFGYSAATNFAGGGKGEVGGMIHPAGEAAYYGYRLPRPLTFDDPCTASGKIFIPPGAGHFLLGYLNPQTLKEWRTPNTLVARINGRGESFHCHAEYCTSRWRCDAGVIGTIVPGQRIDAAEIPAGRAYTWQLSYDPQGADGRGLMTWTLDGRTATCPLVKEHRADGATFTHFGLLPVLKSWDSPGQVWLDDVTIQDKQFDFSREPAWEEFQNRRRYETKNIRPSFDFGWSPTHWAGGKKAGELGGLIFRGDCREPQRMAAYGDPVATLGLDMPLEARGKVSMLRGISDSTASIGFYHSKWSLETNPAQDQSIPRDYLGINIEGPSAEGFFFYPVYRAHGGDGLALGSNAGRAPRIYPDGQVHDWTLKYDPAGANGRGQMFVSLDNQTCTLDLAPDVQRIGATFDRFGICTPWIDGNSVTVFFDDLQYSCRHAPP